MLINFFSLDASAPANELQEQLERTADTVISKLESQIAHLEFLLDEADDKIAILDRQLQAADTHLPEHPTFTVNQTKSTTAEIFDFRLPPELPPAIECPPVLAVPAVVAAPDNTAVRDGNGENANKRRLIASMATQGYNVTEIAKATSMGKGEVMLFLQLNRK